MRNPSVATLLNLIHAGWADYTSAVMPAEFVKLLYKPLLAVIEAGEAAQAVAPVDREALRNALTATLCVSTHGVSADGAARRVMRVLKAHGVLPKEGE